VSGQGAPGPGVELRNVKKLGVVIVALGLLLLGVPLARADAPPSDEWQGKDYGADGESDALNAGDQPPTKACDGNNVSPAGSRIIRRLPSGPMQDIDPSLPAFTPGVCIYLPPGYDTDGLRYPVLYLLHGGGGDQANWVTFGDVQTTADKASKKLIIVMPDGSNGTPDTRSSNNGVWYDAPDGSVKNETYLIDDVIPYITRHFHTIDDRRGRIISGLSNGGLGSFLMAAKHPDLFIAASSMSGNLGGYEHEYDQVNRPSYHDGNTPTPLAENLAGEGIDLIQFWGGRPCGTTDLSTNLCLAWGFEQAFRYDNQNFHNVVTDLHVEDVYAEREGSHSWHWWSTWLREDHLPFLLKRVATAEPIDAPIMTTAAPASWHYKSISPHFTIWGYDIAVEPKTRDDFLSLTDVTGTSMTLTGTGTVRIAHDGNVYDVDLGAGSTKTIAT
jgi:S-formylglutathione hydrolase FrmB